MTASGPIRHSTGLLLVLRRVRDGKVTAHTPDIFADHGDPFPGVLVPFLRELIDHEQARVECQQDGKPGRVVITAAGETLFAELAQSTWDELSGHGAHQGEGDGTQ